ncbi:hypothetical protein C9993_05560 [Marinobacter sp. Z-F4-2]|nr:hypothetical protein C9993_05560 [Marinobacter sp. Z-F4-2]
MSDYLTEKDAAAYLGVSPNTMRLSRYRGRLLGVSDTPTWLRVGTRVMYRRADLRAWLESHAVEQGASPQAHQAPTPAAHV